MCTCAGTLERPDVGTFGKWVAHSQLDRADYNFGKWKQANVYPNERFGNFVSSKLEGTHPADFSAAIWAAVNTDLMHKIMEEKLTDVGTFGGGVGPLQKIRR